MKEREERLLRVPPNDVLIIAEKPSVARDLAKEVKATSCGNGYFHGNGYVVW
jgi:DNA topoisomerase IA